MDDLERYVEEKGARSKEFRSAWKLSCALTECGGEVATQMARRGISVTCCTDCRCVSMIREKLAPRP